MLANSGGAVAGVATASGGEAPSAELAEWTMHDPEACFKAAASSIATTFASKAGSAASAMSPPITATVGEKAQQAGKVSSLEELLAQAQRSSLGSGQSATVGGAATPPRAREKPNRSPGKPSPSTNAGGSGTSGKNAPMAVATKTGKVGNIFP